MTRAAFIGRETAISVVVNAAISAAACGLAFGGRATVPVWTVPGLVADTVPQGFMVALMGTLVPALLARRAIARGRFGALAAMPPGTIVRRALGAAAPAAAVATAFVAAAFAVVRADALPLGTALVAKSVIGALIALVATPYALRAAFAREELP